MNIFRVVGIGLVGITLGGCGTLSEEAQYASAEENAKKEQETEECHKLETAVASAECVWSIILRDDEAAASPYAKLAYARTILVAGQVDRGEVTLDQGRQMVKEYLTLLDLQEQQAQQAQQAQAIQRQAMFVGAMNGAVIGLNSGLQNMAQERERNRQTTCTTRKVLNSWRTVCD